MFRSIGRVVSREHLVQTIWGRELDALSRTIDAHVSRVRHKLRLGPKYGMKFRSIYALGYRLEAVSGGELPGAGWCLPDAQPVTDSLARGRPRRANAGVPAFNIWIRQTCLSLLYFSFSAELQEPLAASRNGAQRANGYAAHGYRLRHFSSRWLRCPDA
ncbi:winged helix-turn-helix domain-containing protein [Paraburkholderia sediminicola]|uniref:winged helix-turn-helix domain-containing protein n=1 Tax=Paraburkholderia sediminicola TaxID=458836 RepID=UPI0038B6D394